MHFSYGQVPILNWPFKFWKLCPYVQGTSARSLLLPHSTSEMGRFSRSHDGLSNEGHDLVIHVCDSSGSFFAAEAGMNVYSGKLSWYVPFSGTCSQLTDETCIPVRGGGDLHTSRRPWILVSFLRHAASFGIGWVRYKIDAVVVVVDET